MKVMRNCTRAGFTLLELMVVITVIMLLMSFLLPALKNARLHAKRILCMSQIKQQHLAQINYATVFEGRFVPRGTTSSPDYQSFGTFAGSVVAIMRKTYVPETKIMICPIAAMIPESGQWGKGYYRRNDATDGTYGGWDTDNVYIFNAYMWMAAYNGGGYTLQMLNGEPLPPMRKDQCTASATFVTHRSINYYNADDLHEIGHFGRGGAQKGAPYSQYTKTIESPVGFGDGHVILRGPGQVLPRMTVGGNYPGTPGFPGTYLW